MKTPERILIVRLSALGDVIHTLPCLDALRRRFPRAHIGWVVEELSRELLEGHPQLDEVFVIPKKRWRGRRLRHLFPEIIPFYRRIRKRRFDVAVDFQGLTKSGWVAWLSGAPLRIGLGGADCRELNGLFTNRKVDPDVTGAVHIIDRNLSLLSALAENANPPLRNQPDGLRNPMDAADPLDRTGIAHPRPLPEKLEWRSFVDEWIRTQGLPSDARFIGLNPGAGWPTKRWPLDLFAETAARIIHEARRDVLVFWGPGEQALTQRIAQLLRARPRPVHVRPLQILADAGISNRTNTDSHRQDTDTSDSSRTLRSEEAAVWIAPPTTVGQSIELTRRCDLFIGGDTGPTHLAAALGVPVVAIYGASDARRNHPGGSRQIVFQKLDACGDIPCWKTQPPAACDLRCLTSITPAEVFSAVRRML